MPTQDHGATCDISVLTDRESLTEAQELFGNSGLYIPNSTYSWLSRSKLIEVRRNAVKHSLVSELVRNRKIYPIHLPEIYDEMSRQIMFEADHNIALTDLRGLFLSTHLQLPLLTTDEDIIDRISNEIGTQVMLSFEAHADWLVIRDILDLYREISYQTGSYISENSDKEAGFHKNIRKIRNDYENLMDETRKSVEEISQGKENPGTLQFQYLAWNILPYIEEYSNQNILESDIIRKITERCILLTAKPVS